jgi:hypothetical protein
MIIDIICSSLKLNIKNTGKRILSSDVVDCRFVLVGKVAKPWFRFSYEGVFIIIFK